MVHYSAAQFWTDKFNLIAYLSERRTNVPLLINKQFYYGNIEPIDIIPLSEILTPLIYLPNIFKETEYYENEETNTLEAEKVENLLNDDSELDDVSESGSGNNYYRWNLDLLASMVMVVIIKL